MAPIQEITLESLFAADAKATTRVECRAGRRSAATRDDNRLLVDEFPAMGVVCCMLRMPRPGAVRLSAAGCRELTRVPAGGWLLTTVDANYWLPCPPRLHRLEAHGRILSDVIAPLAGMALDAGRWSLELEVPVDAVLDVVVYRVTARIVAELRASVPLERQGLFLWGSHTVFSRPSDLHRHLVHGLIYEDRYQWPRQWRICSENDAHALFACCSGLAQATGKSVYAMLQDQLLLSVLARQDPDGGFRHGTWTDEPESHFRLHASAMHLFMDALDERPDDAIDAALARATAFAARQTDDTDLGTWFLHDELELSAAAMNRGPFRWIASRRLGKSPSNMLVLNTHLDTLVALMRRERSAGDRRHSALIASARGAALGVLALRPAEWLYRIVFRLVDLTALPQARAAALPLPVRALKRLAARHVIPRLPRLKTRVPRLVMPGGYVDRALSLRNWAHRYLSINAMDLARTARQLPDDAAFVAAATGAVRFAFTSGLCAKWAENPGDRYALGFLAEALCHLCALDGSPEWRERLAQLLFCLDDLKLGFPPSTLGCNAEIAAPAGGTGAPLAADDGLRVAVLRGPKADEIMLLNTGHEASVPDWIAGPPASCRWRNARGAEVGLDQALPPRGWIIGAPA